MTKLGLIQTNTGLSPDRNAANLADAAERLAAEGAEIIFTPEMSGLLDRNTRRLMEAARTEAQDPSLIVLAAIARRHGVAISIGSLAIRDADASPEGRLANRSFLIAADGHIAARYDKMHLFDVDLPNGDRYRESASFLSGQQIQLADLGWGASVSLSATMCASPSFTMRWRWPVPRSSRNRRPSRSPLAKRTGMSCCGPAPSKPAPSSWRPRKPDSMKMAGRPMATPS